MKVSRQRAFIAIFFVALGFVAIIFILRKTPTSENDLNTSNIARKYLKPAPLPQGWNSTPSMSNKYSAYRSYDQKDYSEALVNFKYSIIDDPNDIHQKFYLGVSLLMTGESRESIREFNYIINESELDSLAAIAKWYKSLALLNLERKDQAQRLLREIDTKESQKLLTELGAN